MTPLAAHADWSVSPAKRVLSIAVPHGDGWRIEAEAVGDVATLLDRLRLQAAGAPVALGVDAPIGMPLAVRFPFADFPAFLRSLTPGSPFFDVCDDPADISPLRPFYPRRPRAGLRRQDLLDGLRLQAAADLLRECERRSGTLPAASPLFWTLGPNQVGKAAIALWRDVLLPALQGDRPPALWPFEGALAELLRPGRVVVAETYPADAMRRLDLGWKGSKRRQADRRAVACRIHAAMHALDARPGEDLTRAIADGFGSDPLGEDRFDSLLGLLRLLQILRDPALDRLPEPAVRRWEGWILGRPVTIG